MNEFTVRFNELIVDTFRSILKVEEQTINTHSKYNLSICEFHLIEAVGNGENYRRTISEIAQELSITLATVTVGIKKLVEKGMVEKQKCQSDGRSVIVSLTKEGVKAYRQHYFFHMKMVEEVAAFLTEEEQAVMLKGVDKLNNFFKQKIGLYERNKL